MNRRRALGRLGTALACAVAGTMVTASALTSGGHDLRPNRNADLVTLVDNARARHDDRASRVVDLRRQVEQLAKEAQPAAAPTPNPALELAAATVAVHGPAVVVTLTDAPVTTKPKNIDEDLLVVHQQDIQEVLNALWAGGAEAATIQGQRVGPTTGVKCVGNTVILDGVPYAPPYVIAGIGDQGALEKSLESSAYLQAYRKFVDAYGLGWATERVQDLDMPGWDARDPDHAKRG